MVDLSLAFVLSALIGLEREIRHKAAGLRTYTVVGFAAALFMLVSKYGFGDVISQPQVVLDPSRVAAQIVSGIGFIGGGVIFMRRDVVKGLTTAASVWLTAAVGMACGANLLVLACATTAGHFVVMLAFPPVVARYLPASMSLARLEVRYVSKHGILGQILSICTATGFVIEGVHVDRLEGGSSEGSETAGGDTDASVVVQLAVRGTSPVENLVAQVSDLKGVAEVRTGRGSDVFA